MTREAILRRIALEMGDAPEFLELNLAKMRALLPLPSSWFDEEIPSGMEKAEYQAAKRASEESAKMLARDRDGVIQRLRKALKVDEN